MAPSRRHVASLYIGVLILLVLTASGRLGTADSAAMFRVAKSVALSGSFESGPCAPTPRNNDCVLGLDGRLYAGYGLLPSVAAAPVVLVGGRLADWMHRDRSFVEAIAVSLSTTLVGAAIPTLLALWLSQLGYSWQVATSTAFLVLFGSVLWHESVKGFYSEPFCAAALVAAAWQISRCKSSTSLLCAGVLFGCAVNSRVVCLIYFPCLALYCLVRRPQGVIEVLRRMTAFSGGVAIAGTWMAWTNWTRFGDITKTGYHLAYPTPTALLSNPSVAGLRDLLVNGEVGLIWFTPWICLLPWAGWHSYRRRPCETMLAGAILLESLLFFSKYAAWHGGWSYGPRLLAPALPFGGVVVAALFAEWPSFRRSLRVTIGLVAACSIAVHASGMFYPMARYYQARNFFDSRGATYPWPRSIIFAQLRDSPRLLAEMWRDAETLGDAPVGLATADDVLRGQMVTEFLRGLPNAKNLLLPDLWYVKVLPGGSATVAIVASACLLFVGCALAMLVSVRALDCHLDAVRPASNRRTT